MKHSRRDGIASKGLTLVEILVSMALMTVISLSISNFLIKSNVTSASLSMRFKEASEIHNLLSDLQQDLRQGAYISPNSYNQRLEYTTYDADGVAIKKIYRISSQNLQLSTDGGNTWGSPYRISDATKYKLTGTPRFLYSGPTNNCTNFVDTTGNGVYGAGDAAGSISGSCLASSGSALSSPAQSSKVALNGFQFTTGTGSPEAIRSLPGDMMIALPIGPVRSTIAPATGVKDPPLIGSFVTNTANSLYGAAFTVKSVTYDAARDRLFIGGSSTGNKIFIAERNGVLNGSPMITSPTSIQLNSVALEMDGHTLMGLDASAKKVYEFNTASGVSLAPASTLDLTNAPFSPGTNLINNPTGIAYDAKTPTDFYIVGADPSSGALKIYQRNKTTGALVGSAWSLPAAFNASHPPAGLAIEPVTGDFLVVRNYVNGSGSNRTIDIYRLPRAGGSSYFSININDLDLGSTTTGTSGNWGLGYDPILNRIFLSDSASAKVYEVVPDRLISPRNF